MKRYKFKCRRDWNTYLTNFDFYAVQSIADSQTIYIMDGEEFAILRHKDGARWKIEETPKIAAKIPFREIRDEILAIYEDIKDLNRMQVNYGGKQRNDALM